MKGQGLTQELVMLFYQRKIGELTQIGLVMLLLCEHIQGNLKEDPINPRWRDTSKQGMFFTLCFNKGLRGLRSDLLMRRPINSVYEMEL